MTIRPALVATLLAAVFAAGCTPDDDAATQAPGPTPVETSAPAAEGGEAGTTAELTEEEREELIEPAFRTYWDVINQTYAAGGAEQATDDMLRVMTGQQLDFWASAFSVWKEEGKRYEGVNRVLYANPTEVTWTDGVGVADVDFCVDMDNTRAFTAEGSPMPKAGRFQSGTAVLQWTDGSWKVAGHREGTGQKDQC